MQTLYGNAFSFEYGTVGQGTVFLAKGTQESTFDSKFETQSSEFKVRIKPVDRNANDQTTLEL